MADKPFFAAGEFIPCETGGGYRFVRDAFAGKFACAGDVVAEGGAAAPVAGAAIPQCIIDEHNRRRELSRQRWIARMEGRA